VLPFCVTPVLRPALDNSALFRRSRRPLGSNYGRSTSAASQKSSADYLPSRPGQNDGMIVTASPLAAIYRERIISLGAQHRLPAAFAYRHFVAAGGLVAYGPDLVNPSRRAASYVSRILNGEKPADLPIQAPTTYELAINLKTAKALGHAIPPRLLARADEVIE
jgi:ABC-type uncharacterized transport system substrate-binding protein